MAVRAKVRAKVSMAAKASAIAAVTTAAMVHTALAACPADLATAKSITLAAGETYRRDIVRQPDGSIDVTRKMPAQREPTTANLFRGLILLSTKAPQVATATYETDLSAIFPLKPGDKHNLKYKGQSTAGTPFEATMTIEVRAEETVTIAGCALKTVVLSRVIRFASGQRTPTFIEHYAPDVGFVVRAAMVTSEGSIVTNANETFETLVVN